MKTSFRSSLLRSLLCSFAFAGLASANPSIFIADLVKKTDGGALEVGDKISGFKVAPVIAEDGGTRFLMGPGSWELAPTDGIVSLKFTMLGFESGYQHELMSIGSDTGQPYGVIRNVNSSGRLEGATVISGANNRYTPGGWHAVEITIDTRKGLLSVQTDGKVRYERKTGIENARFTGVSFANTMKLRDFSVNVAPLPVLSAQEITLIEAAPALGKQIHALPEATPDQARKKTALLYQLEKLGKAMEQNAFDIGLDIRADIEDGLTRDMGRKDTNHPWLQPVVQAKNNPFLDPAMNDRWYQEFVSNPDYAWNLPTRTTAGYTGLYGKHGSFTEAVNATGWLMMAVHPQSPLQDKRELLLRALRRIDVYLEDDYHGRKNYHFFALGAAVMGAVIFDKTYPEMILPRQKARWTEAIRRIAKDHDGNPGGSYSNADLGYGRIRIACGLFLGDKPYMERGLAQVHTWDANIFEDGGSSYILKQNESPGYHGACIDLAYDSFIMTRDPEISDMLRKLELYPISITDSNHTTEWYTVPSWKQSWYGAGSVGPHRVVHYLSGNPYHFALRGYDYFHKPTEPSMKDALLYRSHPRSKLGLPDRYTVYDRNIQGVRMNYGLYSAAMNGRVTDQLVGKNTYVGLTLAEPPRDGKRAFSAAVYGINAFPMGAMTISRESVSVAIGRDFSSLSADYTLARRLSGPSRREVPWKGRQSWLYLPDRMIGLVELTPDGRQRSNAITLNIELGRSKSGALDHSPARKLDALTCQFGELLVRVLDTNLKGIKLAPEADGIAYDGVRGPHNEFHLVDEANLDAWSSAQRDYEGTYYAVIELKPTSTRSLAKVAKIQQGGLVGLKVSCEGRKYTVLYNSGEATLPLSSAPYTPSHKSSVFSDRNTHTFAQPLAVPATLTLPGKQSVILVSGDHDRLYQPGFIGWRTLLNAHTSHSAASSKNP
ncbi:MAG: hypothetical protein EAZ65_04155 [Verrucomicrobia bacterium]|nr:MAG: hypothetical protein EAZ84_02465 [Verrucomicrobiota bacterium]TAE88561.1 MAG: hypothetical protein EAZ82_04835 [Verrucomicrobiota bacterium]TAF27016.1 MAG: hypothetical protein EAZ71_04150 [Verrucomicrobiota bacterium]TAF42272.1 MAG: hypothetical protein EAZ65_04155 [Verrucomicrobiota bacterium]